MKRLLLMLILTPAAAFAVSNRASVVSSAGTYVAGTLTHAGCLGQPLPGISSSATLENRGGFLAGALLQPALDTDGDGIPDELDPDNDNDRLDDLAEITGTPWAPAPVSSDPNAADTDTDGSSDGDEAVAGTDPTDDAHRLYITSIRQQPTGDVLIEWTARNGQTYIVHRAETPDGFPGTPIYSVTHSNTSSPPFYSGNEYALDTVSSNAAFYAVEVLP